MVKNGILLFFSGYLCAVFRINEYMRSNCGERWSFAGGFLLNFYVILQTKMPICSKKYEK